MIYDMNEVLRIYLGTDQNGGYQPIGNDDRLKVAYPDCYDEMIRIIEPYLEFEFTPDWKTQTLIQASDAFATALKEKHPELTDLIVRSLSNRFAFDWK